VGGHNLWPAQQPTEAIAGRLGDALVLHVYSFRGGLTT